MGEEVDALEDLMAEEVKGHSCWQCGRVFSTGSALGGHMSSAHGSLKKLDSSPKNILQQSMEGTQMGKFTCEQCGKGFQSLKGLHGHMRLHSGRDRRGTTNPPTQSLIHENPPETTAPIEEDSFKNLWSRTVVTGKRGRRGTKPHLVDTPETYMAKKKALLSGDPREMKKIMDHHDPSGYFRRAFGSFLGSPWTEKKRDVFQRDFENDYTDENSSAATSSSSSSYYRSNSPLLLCSEKLDDDIADDSTVERTCERSIAIEGTAWDEKEIRPFD